MANILDLNDKQDKIQAAIRQAEHNVSSTLDEVEHWAIKITSAETQRLYGKKYDAAKKKWNTAKKKLSALWKQSNNNIGAIHKLHGKLKNPSIKSDTGWIKATAVKIANGKLYIKRPSRMSNPKPKKQLKPLIKPKGEDYPTNAAWQAALRRYEFAKLRRESEGK